MRNIVFEYASIKRLLRYALNYLVDVTELYIKGAYVTLRKAQEVEAKLVVLKEYSPSCGSSMIYNGEFKGQKIAGNGVTTALLRRHGIQVVSEENLSDFLE